MHCKIEGFNTNQPSVAIIFVGRINGYEECLDNLLYITNKYNPTVFCSLNEDKSSDYINNFCNTFNIKDDQINIEQTILPEWINTFMNMNGIITEDVANGIIGISAYKMYSMYYHQYRAFNLIEKYQLNNNMVFDIVLYYRADMKSTDTLELNMPDDNTVYLPNERGYYGVNDRIAYGNFDTMKKYCNTVNNLDRILVKSNIIDYDNCHRCLNSEIILLYNLNYENILINKIQYNTDLFKNRNNKCIELNQCNP